jgi:hypothetical protein
MFHIVDLNWDQEDSLLWSKLERQAQREGMCGPCEDDHPITAPYIEMMPEESGKEDGSPLRFSNAEIDRLIREAYRQGL